LIEHDLFGKPLHTFPDHALDQPGRRPIQGSISHNEFCNSGVATVLRAGNFQNALAPSKRE
jgi:hypothetical protein